MAYMCVRDIAGVQICGCDACRAEKGWTPNDPPAAAAAAYDRYERNAPVVFETFGECQDPDCDGECAGG